jgi:hypothetical protein
MAKGTRPGRWSLRDDRELIRLAASTRNVERLATSMGRSPKATVMLARRLGIYLKLPSAKTKLR